MGLSTSDILGVEALSFDGTTPGTPATFPAGCNAAVVFHGRYTGGATATISLTIGGNDPTDTVVASGTDSTTVYGALFPGLSEGEHPVAGSGSTVSDRSSLLIIYLSIDVSSLAFVAKDAVTEGAGQFDARGFTLTGINVGDLLLQFDENAPYAGGAPALPAGWTNVASFAGDGSTLKGYRVSALVATGTSQAFASQAPVNWSSLAGVALTQVQAPTISTQPTQQSAAVGATATFDVSASGGSGSLTYQWQSAPYTDLLGNVPGTWSNISGATSSSYTTPTLSSSDNGTWFRCVVTDGASQSVTSLPARLFISGLGDTGLGSANSPPGMAAVMLARPSMSPRNWRVGARALRKDIQIRQSTDVQQAIWTNFFFASSGGTTTTVNALTAAAQAKGLRPTISAAVSISARFASAQAAGRQAAVAQATSVDARSGTAHAQGLPATLTISTALQAATARAQGRGLAASVSAATVITTGTAHASAAGLKAAVAIGTAVGTTTGHATAAGLPATVTSATTIDASTGRANAAGLPANVAASIAVNAQTAKAQAAGLPATIVQATAVDARAGEALASGLPADVQVADGVTVNARTGNAQAHGLPASVALSTSVDARIARAQALGLPASVATAIAINARIGTALASGLHADVALSTAVGANVALAFAVGNPAAVEQGSSVTINARTAAAQAHGLKAALATAVVVDARTGAAIATGLPQTVGVGLGIDASRAAAVAQGYAATVSVGTSISARAGAAQGHGLPATVTATDTTEIIAGVGRATAQGLPAAVSVPAPPAPPAPISRPGAGGGPGGQVLPPRRKRITVDLEDWAHPEIAVMQVLTRPVITIPAIPQAPSMAKATVKTAPRLAKVVRVDLIDDGRGGCDGLIKTADPDLQAFFDILLETA